MTLLKIKKQEKMMEEYNQNISKKRLLLGLELCALNCKNKSQNQAKINDILTPKVDDVGHRVGAVLKYIRVQGFSCFTINLVAIADPSLKKVSIRAVFNRLIDAGLIEVVVAGSKGRGATIYQFSDS